MSKTVKTAKPVTATHTPGPWHAVGCSVQAGRVQVAAINGYVSREHDGESFANARLISAAPDLLASLREMVADLLSHSSLGLNEKEVEMLKRAEAACAKAEGR